MTQIEQYRNGQNRSDGGTYDHQADGLHIVYGDLDGDNRGTAQVIALYDGATELTYQWVEMPSRPSTRLPGMTRAQSVAETLSEWALVYAALREYDAARSDLTLATDGFSDWQWEKARSEAAAAKWELMCQTERDARANLPAAQARADRALAAVLAALADADPATSPADIEKAVARFQLAYWSQMNARRDEIVRGALLAGLSKNRVHEISGISRATIDRLLAVPPVS